MLEPNTFSRSRSKFTKLFRGRFPLVTFAWILLALSVALLFMGSLNRFFDHDEFEAMHTSWKLFQGERLYQDFIQHHFPLLHYLLLPLYTIFGSTTETIIAARVVIFFNVLGMLTATYLIALEVYRKHLVAVVGTLFLTLITLFTAKAIEIRPDVPQSLFVMVGTYLVLRAFRTRSRWGFIMSGACFGVAVLFLQKAIVFLGLIGLVMLARVWSRKLKLQEVVIFSAAAVAPALPFLLYFFATKTLDTFVFWNFTYNTLYYQLRGWEAGKLLSNLSLLYKDNGLIILLFAATLFFFPKKRLEWETLFLAAGVIGFTMLSGRHNPQYYMLAFPFVAILAAKALATGFDRHRALAALVLVFAFLGPVNQGLRRVITPSNAGQLAKIQYVLDLTNKNDHVYDGNIRFNVFRPDVDFIWYMAGPPYKARETLAALLDYHYDIYEAIDRYEPKIISDFAIENMSDPRIADHYVRSPVYDDLYIRTPAQASTEN